MFNRFKSHFTRQTAPQAKSPPPPKDSRGYFRPQSADELLATSLRRQCLRQLWENSALPDGLYQRFYLTPVRQLLSRVQQVPATREGDWSGSGGFIDLTLKFTTYSVRLAKGHLLPPGAAPETQATQSLLWQAVVFWSALFYHLPLLQELEGELDDGQRWLPGVFVPDRNYRFRFRASENVSRVPQDALLAAGLLPEDSMIWLVSVPEAWHCLIHAVSGQSSPVPLTDTLLQEAAAQVCSPLIKKGDSPSPAREIASSTEFISGSKIQSVSPPSEVKSPVQDTSDDARTLLSLFQLHDESSSQPDGKNDHPDAKLIKWPVRDKESIGTEDNIGSSFKSE